MTPEQLLQAAEAKVRDAEKNLAGCIGSMNAHKDRHGSVPNSEVIQLTHLQVVLGQAYATLAMAKAMVEAGEPSEAPTGGDVA